MALQINHLLGRSKHMRPPQRFYEEEFEFDGLIPERWISQARRLSASADLLFNAYLKDLHRFGKVRKVSSLKNLEHAMPATLLYGLALENLLKAILVHNDPSRTSNGRLAEWPGGGHDLSVLAREAEVALDSVETDLLKRLSQFIKWAGRYPIPKKAIEMRLVQRAAPEGFLPLPLQENEIPQYQTLFARLESFAGMTASPRSV